MKLRFSYLVLIILLVFLFLKVASFHNIEDIAPRQNTAVFEEEAIEALGHLSLLTGMPENQSERVKVIGLLHVTQTAWGDQAFLRSAQAIAMAAVDLMTQPNHLAQEKADFKTIMDDMDAAWRKQRFFRQ